MVAKYEREKVEVREPEQCYWDYDATEKGKESRLYLIREEKGNI